MSGGLSRGRANPHNLTAPVDSGLESDRFPPATHGCGQGNRLSAYLISAEVRTDRHQRRCPLRVCWAVNVQGPQRPAWTQGGPPWGWIPPLAMGTPCTGYEVDSDGDSRPYRTPASEYFGGRRNGSVAASTRSS